MSAPTATRAFPGTLTATVRYAVEGDALVIDYVSRADAPTVVNLTNHAYFNLDGSADILGHSVSLAAETFLPTDGRILGEGEPRSVP